MCDNCKKDLTVKEEDQSRVARDLIEFLQVARRTNQFTLKQTEPARRFFQIFYVRVELWNNRTTIRAIKKDVQWIGEMILVLN